MATANLNITALTDELKGVPVLTDTHRLQCYRGDASDATHTQGVKPLAVVMPRSVEDVQKVVRYANEHHVPLVPRGAGTGLNGGCTVTEDSLVVDMSGWDDIVEVDAPNLQVFVRPGVVHARLNEELARQGLFFPPDPGSTKMCTIGGMIGNSASGQRSVKYGVVGQYVLGLEVVLPTGEVVTTGGVESRAIKTSSGYHLPQLFVGSEGTLGIITMARLKVLPLPEKRGLVSAFFDDLEKAGQAVVETFRSGILPSAIEIMDKSAMRAANIYKPELALPDAEALLFFEVDGNPPSVAYDAERIIKIVTPLSTRVEWADKPADIQRLWEARGVVGAAASRLDEKSTRIYAGEDLCVPISQVPAALLEVRRLAEHYGIIYLTYGHIGDGNLHPALVGNREDPEEMERVRALANEIHLLSLRLGGTPSAEHGVGLSRRAYMRQEHGAALDLMRLIKHTMDPNNIMNPGKIWE